MVPSGAAAAPSVRTPPVNSSSSFESGGRTPGDPLGAAGVCAKVRVAFSIKQTTSLLNIVILSIVDYREFGSSNVEVRLDLLQQNFLNHVPVHISQPPV